MLFERFGKMMSASVLVNEAEVQVLRLRRVKDGPQRG
jgi:hypothetical protein